MKRLGKILVLAAVAMLAMGVWANGVMAAPTPDREQPYLEVRIDPLEGFFDKKYAKSDDAASQRNPNYGKISTIRVLIYRGELQIKDLSMRQTLPVFVISSDKLDMSKIEFRFKLEGVADEVVKTITLPKHKAKITISAAPSDNDPDIYQVKTKVTKH